MEQNTSQKPQKSKFWVIANIWSYIIVYLIVVGIIWRIISWLLSGFLGENILSILEWLIIAAVFFYSSKVGIRTVLNKAIIPRADIVKISIGLTMVFVIIQTIVTVIYGLFNFGQIGKLIFIDVVLFFSSYYWLKKSIL